MKKRNLLKIKIATAVLGLSSYVAQAQDFKQIINDGLNDYLVPFIGLGVLIGVIVGVFKNWEQVNNPQTRKEGLMNTGIIILYAGLCIGVIVGAAALVSGMTLNL